MDELFRAHLWRSSTPGPSQGEAEDCQYLLAKSVSALNMKAAEGGEEPIKLNIKSKHESDEEFFPCSTPSKKVFPFTKFFEAQIKREWEKPTANRQIPGFVHKLYAIPSYTNDVLRIPLKDAPVVALQFLDLVSKDGEGQIKDVLDRKVDQLSRCSPEAMAMAIKANFYSLHSDQSNHSLG
uniref:Uncharacterized protein n=1 Tax=Sphaerodactylus townsendi TaxID=933632 RepID=A0ACB8G2D0_9SAUR